jgi:methyl acetate hydrolase
VVDARFRFAADHILREVVTSHPRAPGVVAMAGDRAGNFYEGAAGVRRLGEDAPMTTDSIFALFSLTKAITATAALQLVEQGRLDLDAPAKRYAPEIATLQVLEGFDEAGAPRLRPPKREITTRMLLLHTAGFGYPFWNAICKRLAELDEPIPRGGMKRTLMTPLLFDPGERWEYGRGVDWCGLVVEGIAGERLDAVFKARIFEPLGMNDTGFLLSDSMLARRAAMHQREADGALTPLDSEPPAEPEVYMGGGALFGTALDYMRFLRMWLNDGACEYGRVLEAETVELAARNGLGDMKIKRLPSVDPLLTNEAEFFPGQSKSWSLAFMVNDEQAPTGRPAGSLGWAGLGNLYYWLDRKTGVAGVWTTQIFPFMDPTSVEGFMAFETAVYEGLARGF